MLGNRGDRILEPKRGKPLASREPDLHFRHSVGHNAPCLYNTNFCCQARERLVVCSSLLRCDDQRLPQNEVEILKHRPKIAGFFQNALTRFDLEGSRILKK